MVDVFSSLIARIQTTLEKKDNQEKICRTTTPVLSFWLTINILQRSAGALGYYSGRRGSIILGSVVVAFGSVVSNHICTKVVYPSLECCNRSKNSWWSWLYGSSDKKRLGDENIDASNQTVSLATTQTILTVVLYSTLSLNWCQTAFPSSIISIGSYAKGRNLPYAFSAAVPSTSAVATAGERNSVNRKGKIFGCHHCGSRQIFSKQRFIADHMPPTKMANEMNENFWRKWLNIKVKQALWPQCQDCFQMQGSAVRANEHRLVYVSALKMNHFAFLFAIIVSDYLVDANIIDKAEDYLHNTFTRIKRRFD